MNIREGLLNITRNKISNWSLLKLIISDQALDVWLNMLKILAVFQKSCLSINSLLVKMQNYAVLKINVLGEFLYQI